MEQQPELWQVILHCLKNTIWFVWYMKWLYNNLNWSFPSPILTQYLRVHAFFKCLYFMLFPHHMTSRFRTIQNKRRNIVLYLSIVDVLEIMKYKNTCDLMIVMTFANSWERLVVPQIPSSKIADTANSKVRTKIETRVNTGDQNYWVLHYLP
jgi:hypothetical protein